MSKNLTKKADSAPAVQDVANLPNNTTATVTSGTELDVAKLTDIQQKAAGTPPEFELSKEFEKLTAPNSISVEQAEKIAQNRVTHEDERPPNSVLNVPELISRAWDEVKGAADPPLSGCVQSHVEKVYFHAQGILNGGSPQQGDTRLARLEQAVARLMRGA